LIDHLATVEPFKLSSRHKIGDKTMRPSHA
jgi:hypothetical protein